VTLDDVTDAYNSIGHSDRADDIITSLRIGSVDSSTEDEASELIKKFEMDIEERGYVAVGHDYSAMWHANRRKCIRRDHPEVAALQGHNNFTGLIGLATVIVHWCTCLYVQHVEVGLLFTVLLAYSVGAVCKMYQFAVNHDLCHNTAGWIFQRFDLLKRSAMQMMTLPSVGG